MATLRCPSCASRRMRAYKRAKFNGFLKLAGGLFLAVAAYLILSSVIRVVDSPYTQQGSVMAEVLADSGGVISTLLCAGVAFILLAFSLRQVWRCRSCGHETVRTGWRS